MNRRWNDTKLRVFLRDVWRSTLHLRSWLRDPETTIMLGVVTIMATMTLVLYWRTA